MTIECYHSACPFHSTHTDPNEGPFCFETDCKATPAEMEVYDAQRVIEVEKFNASLKRLRLEL